ncbi:MAG TPA: glycosyltransferase family 4 protein [Jiangellales bacterium]|nr:glycosyltransferase family 4 protein [Jiangellales bacterium]
MKPSRPQITILVANLPAERDRRVIRECLALEARGYDVTVIAPRGDKSLRILPGSRGTRLRPYPVFVYGHGVISFAVEFGWSFICVAARLLGEVLHGRAHAVQVCNPPDVYWPLALLMRIVRRPWVFDHHDLCPEVYSTRAAGRPNRWVYRTLVALEWLTLRTASAVIATNESFRQNALRRGVRPENVVVVRNGPATTEIDGIDSQPARETEAGRTHTIVYLGVLGLQDNVEGAVLAANELVQIRGRTDWRLVIAGDGETMPALTKLVAERGLGDVVQFAGWLEPSEVDALLRTASVAIQPDLPTRMNHLSTMAKTVEYLGRGVPVVAADLLETRRSAGEAAVYVPTGSALEFARAIDALLNDPEARVRMRARALARFTEQLSWEHQADIYVRQWDRLLARRRRRPPSRTLPVPAHGPKPAQVADIPAAAPGPAQRP